MGKAFEGLGRALALLRVEQRMSQSEVARRSGVNKSLISRYERGQVEPTFDSVNRLLAALGANRRDLDEMLARVQQREGDGEESWTSGQAPEAYLVIPIGGRGRPSLPEVEALQRRLGRVTHYVHRVITEPERVQQEREQWEAEQARREQESEAASGAKPTSPEEEG